MIQISKAAMTNEVKVLLEENYRAILAEAESLFSRGTLLEIRRNKQRGIPQIAFDICSIQAPPSSVTIKTWTCQCWIESHPDRSPTIVHSILPPTIIAVNLSTQSIECKWWAKEYLRINPDEITLGGKESGTNLLDSEWEVLEQAISCLLTLQVGSWQQREAIEWDGSVKPERIAEAEIVSQLHKLGIASIQDDSGFTVKA